MTTIRLRRGTAAEWTTANPVLALGEPGFERDTGKQKIGDGATAWAALAYLVGGATATTDAGALTTGTLADARLSSPVTVSLSKADTAVQPAGLTKTAVGLGNVDNTADTAKPVSTAQATALGNREPANPEPFLGLNMAAIGHSFLSHPTNTQSWPAILGARLRSTITSYGVPGSLAATSYFRAVTSWTPGAYGAAFVQCMHNDSTVTGAAPGYQATLQSLLAWLTSVAVLDHTSTCFAFGTGWTTVTTGNGVTQHYHSTLRTTSTVGSYFDLAWNGDGCTLIFQGLATGGGTVTVNNSVTGTTAATQQTDIHTPLVVTNNGSSATPVVLKGYGAGTHTVRVTMTAGTAVSVNSVIIPSPKAATVIVAEEGPNPTFDAQYVPFKTANAAVAANFPTSSIVRTPTWSVALTQDGLHPNDEGSNLIVRQILTYLYTLGYRDGQNRVSDSTVPTYTSPGAPAFITGSATVAGAPTALAATSVNPSTVVLSWTAPASNGGATITDYAVQYATSSSGPWTTFAHTASATTSSNVTGLTTGTPYYFQVAAVNGAGTGAYSTVAGPATPAPIADLAGAVFADNFNRADSTTIGVSPTGGFTPTFRAGSASIVSNKMQLTAYTAMYWAIGANDYTFQSTFIAGITGNASVDIRQSTSDMQWKANGQFTDNSDVVLGNVGTYTNGDTVKVKALGTAFTFWVNGIQTGTATGTGAAGGIGFRGDTGMIVDNLSATTP